MEQQTHYASHIFMDESKSPELVGWVPTQKQFDSSKFFKEDLPLSLPREGFGLRESDNLYGKPPEKPAVSICVDGTTYCVDSATYLDRCRKAVERWNLLLSKHRIIIP